MTDRFTAFLKGAEKRLVNAADVVAEAIEHGGEKGTALEDEFKRELRSFMPRAYDVTSGLVLGANGSISGQQDVLIYDSARYPVAEYADGRRLLVPESVYGAISLKMTLDASLLSKAFDECEKFRDLMDEALGDAWKGFYALFAYRFEGNWETAEERFYNMVAAQRRGHRLDVVCVLGRSLLLDAHSFRLADDRRKGFGGMAGTARFFVPADSKVKGNDTYIIQPRDGAFSGMYQLLLTRLSNTSLVPLRSLTLPRFVDETMRVEDVLAAQIVPPEGTRLANDSEMTTTCPTCHTGQTLAEAAVAVVGDETVYTCRNGCQAIVIVGRPGDIPWEGRGYRMGDRVIRNVADLFYQVVGSGGGFVLRASPAALMKERPKK